MKLKISQIVLIYFIFFISFANSGQSDASVQNAFHWNKLIGRGINLGNALEAPKEGDWGLRLEAEHFKLVASKGFQSVRIPIRWSAHAQKQAPYTIDDKFFKRVDWAVKQALDLNLVAIINIHHYQEIMASPEKHKARFLAFWKQISEHYASHPETLYFEILNEPSKKLTSEIWNDYLAEAISIVRESNPNRAILVGPGHYNSLESLTKLKLPDDRKNLIVSFHYYEPFKFTHQGAHWLGKKSNQWLGTTWDATYIERRAITRSLNKAKTWALKNKVPLHMGEFGVFEKADMESRVRWTTFLREEAEKRRISWSYWEFCRTFGIYDLDNNKWRKDLLEALQP
ncbi:glycoside hydrolase family 5 protein [Vibrio sp. JC009]|uniref:glycoside hydrolase family 5 protein n=1 Tax=Vibrio sp. JC009 TaxID=2912314 RepID=UPI0023B10E3C|nr:glycoside hydrolase family 5 protein [Vibrio sp. JC009]WED20615.1 glycoside hydrolase family 5 protein [Vibrio sp. JC009]